MPKRDRNASPSELPRHYEGQAVLAELMAGVGSVLSPEDVKSLFSQAQQVGELPAQIFPELFDGEPRFASPEQAARLYGNLFGLWDRLAAGKPPEPRGLDDRPAPPPPAPPPEPIVGSEILDAFVERGFLALTTLPPKESRRLRDRFEQRESELLEVLGLLGVAPGAEDAARDVAFELWLLTTWAFGERAGRTTFASLRGAVPTGNQPALQRYIAEWLSEAELDEEDPLLPADRAKVEPVLASAAEQLATPTPKR
jgi:hypothetical protein